jgi:hypothetical protein
MNFWRQYAQLTRFRERADNSINTCKSYNLAFNQVHLDDGEPIDLKDPATKAFFELMAFKPTVPFANLAMLNRHIRSWVKETACNPKPTVEKVHEFFETRNTGAGWLKLDKVLKHLSGWTLSETVDATDIMVSPGDEILAGDDFFSVNIGVCGDDLVSDFEIIHCLAVASSFERSLPMIQVLVDDHMSRFTRLRALGSDSSEYVSTHKNHRNRPLWVSVNQNGDFFMEVSFEKKDGVTDYNIDWGRVKFKETDMVKVEAVIAIATKSQGNRLKGRYLEEGLGL